MLTNIESCQMKAESINSAQETLNVEKACARALVCLQARRDEPHVGTKLPQVLISVRPAFIRMPQPLANLRKEHPIWHPVMAGGGSRPGTRQQHPVLADPLFQLRRRAPSPWPL